MTAIVKKKREVTLQEREHLPGCLASRAHDVPDQAKRESSVLTTYWSEST